MLKRTLLALLLLTLPGSAEPSLERRCSWPNTEILQAVPSADGALLITRRYHWPDGHEAEEVPQSQLDKLRSRARTEPRFADPEIVLLTRREAPRLLDWGWNPAFSPHGGVAAYSQQVQPLTGKRALAETLRGNRIVELNLATGSKTVVAESANGFLSTPTYSPDGSRILYCIGDAVNGAWPGTVGAGVAGHGPLLAPRQIDNLWVLVHPFWSGNSVLAVQCTPLGGGTYMADSYRWELLDLDHPKVAAHALGTLPAMPRVQVTAGKLDLHPGPGEVSPDGRWTAIAKDQVVELSGPTRGITRIRLKGEAESLRWSGNSKFLVILAQDEAQLYQVR